MASLMDSVMAVATELTAISVTSSASAGLTVSGNSGPFEVVRLLATTDCHVVFDGTTPTTASTRIVAGSPEYFKMNTGAQIKAIRNATDGTLYVTRMV